MTGTDKAAEGSERRGGYFFLSYAHSPPLAGHDRSDPDQWVQQFFDDLTAAVRRAAPGSGPAPGFLDREIPLGADWKESFTAALGRAEVFVPLYSPGYFARSWPGREWACFHRRMVWAGQPQPLRRFVPALWIPLPRGQDPPGLREALEVGAAEPEYAENGLRALLRLRPYRDTYRQVVDRLAERIVTLAENEPLGPSAVPDIGEIGSAFGPEESPAVFTILVASTDGRWRPFPPQQRLPLAEYAAEIAERLDFAVVTEGIGKAGRPPTDRPGIVLIDPPFAAADEEGAVLRALLRDLPPWMLPVLVLDRAGGPADDARAAIGRAGTPAARQAAAGIGSLRDFVALLPSLITEAERQYLRHARAPRRERPPAPELSRPRLSPPTPPEPPLEEHDA
ncbi:hypothetical protein DPM19_09395 [Actinomadura craniellae]|uniref:TIR domain-containing protein n=1 Tax=Actinomadura craniellae TaxID=2231787 RepID=A0A365HCF8_9ACTN|nr:TIR-like protein FxsC [Actinomadura craniellae]RAY15953.1 hypothetical protein DPM19_09395 [Actinomadura craniellae]